VNCCGSRVMDLLIDVPSCPFHFSGVKFQLPGYALDVLFRRRSALEFPMKFVSADSVSTVAFSTSQSSGLHDRLLPTKIRVAS